MHLSVVCPIYNTWSTTPEAWWEIGGELTYPNGASPHSWGINLHTIPLHKHPYLPVVHSVWQGDRGICGIHKEFSKNIQHQRERVCNFEWIGTIPTKIISTPRGRFWWQIPLLSPTSVCKVGHTIERYSILTRMCGYVVCLMSALATTLQVGLNLKDGLSWLWCSACKLTIHVRWDRLGLLEWQVVFLVRLCRTAAADGLCTCCVWFVCVELGERKWGEQTS